MPQIAFPRVCGFNKYFWKGTLEGYMPPDRPSSILSLLICIMGKK